MIFFVIMLAGIAYLAALYLLYPLGATGYILAASISLVLGILGTLCFSGLIAWSMVFGGHVRKQNREHDASARRTGI